MGCKKVVGGGLKKSKRFLVVANVCARVCMYKWNSECHVMYTTNKMLEDYHDEKRGRINSPLITYSENCIILTLIGQRNLVRKFAIVIRSNLHDGIRMNWSAYERKPLKSCVTCDDVWWWRRQQQRQQQQNPPCSLFVVVNVFRGKCIVVTVNHVR